MRDDYISSPNPTRLYRSRDKVIAGVCGGIADGQTIQKPDGRGFGPSDWDGDLPSQKICTEIDAPAVLKLIHDVIVAVRED